MTRILYLCLFLVVGFCESANILFFTIPYTEKSHYIMLRPIGLELARRGHNVTVVTTFEEMDPPPNYTQVMVDDRKFHEDIDDLRPNLFKTVDMTTTDLLYKSVWMSGLTVIEKCLNESKFQDFIAKDNQFDLVISEQFAHEALHTLAHKYNAPLILVSTFGNVMKQNFLTRNPLQLATVVFDWAVIQEPTSFFGRLKNLYFSLYEYGWWRVWYLDEQKKLVDKYIKDLPQPVPSLLELQRNAALTLMNTHFSYDPPTAYLPNMIEIGGAHLSYDEPRAKLPGDLKEILDNAKHGVIYVSLGSNVRSSELPPEKKKTFLEVFSKLKQTVLWKWEDDTLGATTDNVFTRKWFPQKEVLAHPNVKVFISHGGLIGTQEATFHGVPMVGIPIYGDQYNNILQVEKLGYGRVVRYYDIEQELGKTLLEVLNDESYSKKAKVMSARFKDRPVNALETIMYWVEFVLRNKGAEYMRNPALDLSWVAYNMFDVYAFILAVIFVCLYIVAKVTSFVIRFVSPPEQNKSDQRNGSKKFKSH